MAKELIYKVVVDSVKSIIDSTPENERVEFHGNSLIPIKEFPSFVSSYCGDYGVGEISDYRRRYIGLVYKGDFYKYVIPKNAENIKKVSDTIKSIMITVKNNLLDFDSFEKTVKIGRYSFTSVVKEFEKLMGMSIRPMLHQK